MRAVGSVLREGAVLVRGIWLSKLEAEIEGLTVIKK